MFRKLPFILLALLILSFSKLHAQSPIIGKPDGNLINFVNTNSNGGQLAHIQDGTFGSFGVNDRWIGIGQPQFAGQALPVYGFRIQDDEQVATLSLNNNQGTIRDLELQWGPESGSKFRLNFITNPFTNSQRNVLTANNRGNVGIDQDNPTEARLEVRVTNALSTSVTAFPNPNFAGTFDHGVNGGNGSRSTGDAIGALNEANLASGTSSLRFGTRSFASGMGAQSRVVLGAFCEGKDAKINYGVAGVVSNSVGSVDSINFGVYGAAPVNRNGFAGFFAGDVEITGALSVTSDRRLKENIQAEENAMDRIMRLNPTTYVFRKDGEAGQMNLARGLQHGFIAQELEEVFPELVGSAIQQLGLDKLSDLDGLADVTAEDLQPFEFKTVNLLSLIPVLTKGIQEQQATIEAQDAKIEIQEEINQAQQIEIDALKARLAALETTTPTDKGNVGASSLESPANVLFQNQPNPFDQQTKIRYEIQQEVSSAQLLVFDMNGRQVRSFDNLKPGVASVTLDGSQLEAGMYFYSLIVNGQEVATKRMILTK